ncbi:MAG TPA: CDP-alcohol phosphatidyltransferase family protein [Lachnospiraceae bacterium]|nr:CDP-alcohol phosphatidyltransferase family protein [Lachnospiraceae bacterium]
MSKRLKKYIPNVISCIRIVISLFLIGIEPYTIGFLILYIICGLTDICDGFLARKWNVSSKYGALLDSIADLFFDMVVLYIFIQILEFTIWMLIWIGVIVVIRCISILIGVIKYHTVAFIHTNGNKLTGILLFCFLILMKPVGLTLMVIVICIVAIISAIEELMIMISSVSLDRDRKRL